MELTKDELKEIIKEAVIEAVIELNKTAVKMETKITGKDLLLAINRSKGNSNN